MFADFFVILFAAHHLSDYPLQTDHLVAALVWVGVSHSLIDRRAGVRWWMEHTGQRGFLAHGGAAHVDQAFHIGVGLLPAAMILAAM